MPHYTFSLSSGINTINVPGGGRSTRYAKLLEVVMPNTLYNIRLGINDTLDFKVGATVYSATILPGAYTASSIMIALTAAMTSAVGNTWVMNIDGVTLKMSISGVTPFDLLLNSGINTSKSIGSILGFGSIDITGVTSVSAGSINQLSNPFSLYLRCSEIGGNVYTVGGQNYAFRIPMITFPGAIVVNNSNSGYDQEYTYANSIQLNQLSMTLCYIDGKQVDLNGSSFEIVLELK